MEGRGVRKFVYMITIKFQEQTIKVVEKVETQVKIIDSVKEGRNTELMSSGSFDYITDKELTKL